MCYYCIVCSRLHDDRYNHGRVFEKGFYIDTRTGSRIHLGMCDEEDNRLIQDHIHQAVQNNSSKMDNILISLSTHDYIKEFVESWRA
ncbi:hypothetical protein BC351_04600 [Paenibacillus ferrarius]|uniref:DUF3973 domain-containing protein n=1 Tax=Paenibacillus ferrarius TaxID=1469647 RepID=A0A1V4HLA2_9BACL|nr:hypothetical protein BC351_04600 [Paenibacillus ferrarius]